MENHEKMEELCTIVTTEPAKEITLDLRGTDLMNFLKLELIFDQPGTFSMRLNRSAGRVYVRCDGPASRLFHEEILRWRAGPDTVVRFWAIVPGGNVLCSVEPRFGDEAGQIGCAPGVTWEQLETMEITGETLIPAGTRVVLRGVRYPTKVPVNA